jgi:hypothetical protein
MPFCFSGAFAFPLGAAATADLIGALVAACAAADSWKCQQHLRDLALTLARGDTALARRVIGAMQDGPAKRRAERRLAAGQFPSPRSFTW